jgi:hypothetical protein
MGEALLGGGLAALATSKKSKGDGSLLLRDAENLKRQSGKAANPMLKDTAVKDSHRAHDDRAGAQKQNSHRATPQKMNGYMSTWLIQHGHE